MKAPREGVRASSLTCRDHRHGETGWGQHASHQLHPPLSGRFVRAQPTPRPRKAPGSGSQGSSTASRASYQKDKPQQRRILELTAFNQSLDHRDLRRGLEKAWGQESCFPNTDLQPLSSLLPTFHLILPPISRVRGQHFVSGGSLPGTDIQCQKRTAPSLHKRIN